ncbi:unnamed protein product, partial [marine sediment metagenome]
MSTVKQKLSIDFKGEHSMAELIGDRDELLQLIERKYNVEIFALGNDLEILGKNKNVKEVARLIEELALQINLGQKLNSEKVSDSIKI